MSVFRLIAAGRRPWAAGAGIAIVLTAGLLPATASAQAAAHAATGEPATCGLAQLRVSVPEHISGDPAQGMGKQAWNIEFRNAAAAACTLRGWPAVAVRGSDGRTVPTVVSDVRFSNLATVPERPVVLAPGAVAVVTATSAADQPGCATSWRLGVTPPGSSQAVTVGAPRFFTPCVGGRLALSPVYPLTALRAATKAMAVSKVPPMFPATTAHEPGACPAAALRASVGRADWSPGHGFTAVLRLSAAGGACTMNETWPTVRLYEAGGLRPMAKILPYAPGIRAASSVLNTYEHGTVQRPALTLRPGGSASVAVVATGTGACHQVTAMKVYPTADGAGAGVKVTVPAPVRICGTPRLMPFLPAGPAARVASLTSGALTSLTAKPRNSGILGDSPAGWWYGTDSAFPDACGTSVPYGEPNGVCSNGTNGNYGGYIGEAGSWLQWQGCANGLNWIQGNYNAAQANLKAAAGLGAAPYWFMAGPGRDPNYNGTDSEGTTWGDDQAQRMVNDLSNTYGLPIVFEDVENNGAPPDNNGWNTVWNGPCGGTVEGSSIASSVDYSTFDGFRNWIVNHTGYAAGVYAAGGSGYGSWSGIFGTGYTLADTFEWTDTYESSALDWPSGWSDSDASTKFFANAPGKCYIAWQFSGGDGVLNQYGGDYDQINGNDEFSCD